MDYVGKSIHGYAGEGKGGPRGRYCGLQLHDSVFWVWEYKDDTCKFCYGNNIYSGIHSAMLRVNSVERLVYCVVLVREPWNLKCLASFLESGPEERISTGFFRPTSNHGLGCVPVEKHTAFVDRSINQFSIQALHTCSGKTAGCGTDDTEERVRGPQHPRVGLRELVKSGT